MRKAVRQDLILRMRNKIHGLEKELDEREEAEKEVSKAVDAILVEVCRKYGSGEMTIRIPVPDARDNEYMIEAEKKEGETDPYVIRAVKKKTEDQTEE